MGTTTLLYAIALVLLSASSGSSTSTPSPEFSPQDVFTFLEDERDIQIETASKVKEILDEAPASATVITREQIEALGVRTLTDLLRTVPGMSSSLTRTGLRQVDVRGRTTDNSNGVKLLINGHSLNEPFTGSGLPVFDDRPLDDVKQIEIIRGPGSALYGANAFLAIVNIITRDNDGANVIARYDTDDTYFTSAYVGGPVQGAKISGHASRVVSDGPRAEIAADRLYGTSQRLASLAGGPGHPGQGDRSYDRTDLDVAAEWKWLTASARYSKKRRGDFAGQDYYLTYDPEHPETRSNFRFSQLGTELSAHAPTIAQRLSLSARVFYDHVMQDADLRLTPLNFALPVDLDGDGADELFAEGRRQRRLVHESMLGWEAQAVLASGGTNQLILGYVHEIHRLLRTAQWANFDPEVGASLAGGYQRVRDFNEPSYAREVVAAYLEDIWEARENLRLTAGVRIDHYNDFGSAVSPRAALVYRPFTGVYVKALYGHAFRAPTFDELFTRGNPDVIGNPTLDPEQLDTGELGLILSTKDILGLSANLKTTAYWTHISDAIEPSVGVALTGPDRLRNVGAVDLRGVEAETRIALPRAVSLSGNVTYLWARDADTGANLVGVPRWLGNVQLFASPFPSPFSGMTLGLGANIVGPRSREVGDNPLGSTGERLYPDRANPLPANVDVSASLSTTDMAVGPLLLSVSVRAENLLGADLRDPTPPIRRYGDLTFPDDLPREGRTFMVTLNAGWVPARIARSDG